MAVAVVVGGIEMLGLIQGEYNLSGWFWKPIAEINGNAAFGILGFAIIGIPVLAWIVSLSVYAFMRCDEIDEPRLSAVRR